jgi:hypothetical protein
MTKEELGDYILNMLGCPVINVELHPDQILHAINDTMQLFIESHYDGTDLSYYPLRVNVHEQQYVLPDNIFEVTNVLDDSNNMFIFDEPLLLTPNYGNSITPDVTGLDVRNVETLRQMFKMAEKTYNYDILFEFNSMTKKINFHAKPRNNSTYICEVYQTEESMEDFYDNIWVKRYATALCKKIWSNNLGKFSGANLPGGVSVDYIRLATEAQQEITELIVELRDKYSQSSSFFIG